MYTASRLWAWLAAAHCWCCNKAYGPALQARTTDSAADHTTTWTNQLPPKPEEVAVAQLHWLPAQKMNLTMECIASTSVARVMKV